MDVSGGSTVRSKRPIPVFKVDGEVRRFTTQGDLVPIRDDSDTKVRGKDFKNLRQLLMALKIVHMDDENKYFWTDQLLRSIMTRDRIVEELRRMKEREDKGCLFQNRSKNPKVTKLFKSHEIEWYASKICSTDTVAEEIAYGANNCVQEDSPTANGPKSYLKIFSILLLCQRKSDIGRFIKYDLCDGDLPLIGCDKIKEDYSSACSRLGPLQQKCKCFKYWKTTEAENFQRNQYRVLVPFFGHSSDQITRIKHAKYHPRTILPWIQEDRSKRMEGGYGNVSCIRPHPTSHGFHGLKQVKAGNGMFAIKMIKTDKPSDFDHEAKMLRLFSDRHDHLITLLMTYSLRGQNVLIFPWAGCDLEAFWEQNQPPLNEDTKVMDLDLMRWISAQILGIVSALNNIHNPPHLVSEKKKYARHGDIKPENIFWFPPNEKTEGSLVIGDFGISEIHGEKSKSNIPNESLPRTPDYRPPECDQRGGSISRAFDIWTLGCLLMEMICWALGGQDMLQKFDQDRTRIPYMGTRTNIWFDVKVLKEGGTAIMVKETVVEWMRKLDEHEGCTEYFHDLLDIISDHMIVVLSKSMNRIKSKPLLEKIKAMHTRIEDPSYSQAKGQARKHYNDPVAVRTEMNAQAEERIKQHGLHGLLLVYQGVAIQRAKTEIEMRNVD